MTTPPGAAERVTRPELGWVHEYRGTMVQSLVNCSRRRHPGPPRFLWEQAGCGRLDGRAR